MGSHALDAEHATSTQEGAMAVKREGEQDWGR
jgi:hypothetical protein